MDKATHTVTSESPFCISSRELLSVRAGVSISKVLSEASDTLDAVRDIVDQEASNRENAILWGGLTLIEIAKGLVDAALFATSAEADHG